MPRRYMQNLRAQFVSLVSKAANRREFLTRKDADGNDDRAVQVPIIKRDDLAEDGVRYISGVVYEPDMVDTQGDQMTAAEIEKAAHRYMRDFQGIDVEHSFKAENGCWVAENTVHKSDSVIGGQKVPAGAWTMTVGIEDPRIIAKVDSGELNGFSVGGYAQYVVKEDIPEEPQGEQGMFRKLFAWLGESLGLLKPTQGAAPAPQAPVQEPVAHQRTAEPPARPPQTEEKRNEPPEGKDTGPSGEGPEAGKQEVRTTMTTAELNEIMNSLKEALVTKGLAQPDESAPVQKNVENAEAPSGAEGGEMPAGDVLKAEEPAVDTAFIAACVKSAVREEIAPMKATVEALAKSRNMPTNIKDAPAPVKKESHYMDGFFAE